MEWVIKMSRFRITEEEHQATAMEIKAAFDEER